MKIRNPRTGETKDVSLEELPQYGINPDEALRKKLETTYNKGWLDLPPEVGSWKEYGQKLPAQAGKELKSMGEGLKSAVPMLLQQAPPARLAQSIGDVEEMLKGGKPWERRQEEAKLGGKAMIEAGKSVASDLYHLLRHPTQQFYKKPVGTALDAAMLTGAAIKGGKAISNAVKSAQAEKQLSAQLLAYAARDPDEFARMINQMANQNVDEASRMAAAAKVAKETAGKATKETVEQVKNISPAVTADMNKAEQSFASMFVIPQKRAKDLRPLETSRAMVRYNITGNFDDMKNAASAITGQNGILTNINRDIVGSLDEIDFDKVAEVVRETGDRMTEITNDDVNKVLRMINRKIKPSAATTMPDLSNIADETLDSVKAQQAIREATQDKYIEALGKIGKPAEVVALEADIAKLSDQANDLGKQLQTIQKSLKTAKAGDAADELVETAAKLQSQIAALDNARINKVMQKAELLEKAKAAGAPIPMPKELTEPIEMITTGPIGDVSKLHPAENTDDLMRQLERIGADYRRHSTYLTPNLRMEQLSDLYKTAARALENAIREKIAKLGEGTEKALVQQYTKNPEYIAKIARVSPTLAEDFQKATTFRQLRALQAPFVRLSQMIDMTRDAALTTANKLAAQAGAAIAGGAGSEIGLGPFSLGGRYSPVGMIGKAVAVPILGPALQTQMTGAIPKIISKSATAIPKTAAATRAATKAVSAIAKAPWQAAGSYLRNAFLRRMLTTERGKSKKQQPVNLAMPKEE